MNELLAISVFLILLCSGRSADAKIKGVSFVGANEKIDTADVNPIVQLNANWVSIIPYGFIRDDEIVYNSQRQWWGERIEGAKESVKLCRAQGLKVMVKPQVWIHGAYTGDYKPENEGDWKKFEASYRKFIVDFLELAEELGAEMFCIGTEWRTFVSERKQFWTKLSKEANNEFSGKLTYAANWDDYKDVHFWDKMDFVGVDAYFPLTYSTNPSQEEVEAAWNNYSDELAAVAKETKKKILFTEVGYKSMVGALIKPWEHSQKGTYSAKTQAMAYRALFKKLWNQEWFEGLFLWKWYHNHEKHGGKNDNDFTPQNKLAEKVIRTFWSEN